MAFTKFTATFTNGSSVATNVVLLRGSLAYFARGTRIVVSSDPVLAEIEAIAAPSNSEITLADTWDFDTGVYTCTANMTSEGVRDAVQKIREYIGRIQAEQAALTRLYDSAAEGIAGTVSGEYFNVITPSDPDVYSQLYLNDLGVAVLQGEMPTSLAIEAAQSAAELSEDAAAASETAAANSATVASTKATEASDSAAEALASEIAAQAAQAATEQIFDQFGDQYLGAKASDPTVDNDGDSLTEGDIYFNTTDNVLKFYTGTAWVAPEDIATSAAAAALASEQAAAASESAAATSETNAASSATSAAGSATAASGSASDAAASEAAALASEQAAATSETNAAGSATAAAASATAAAGSASDADDSAIAAAASESAAATSETNAATSSTNAAASATASAASATDSANSASAASASASNAATSATNAASSATAAANSATAAETAEDNALASYNSFIEKYYGAYASEPTVDPLGNAMDQGDLYFNTGDNTLYIFNGTNWQRASTTIEGIYDVSEYTNVAGQTTFNLTYDVGLVQVLYNGVQLAQGDFTATDNATVVLDTAVALAADVITIIRWGAVTESNIIVEAPTAGAAIKRTATGAARIADGVNADEAVTKSQLDGKVDDSQLATAATADTIAQRTSDGSLNVAGLTATGNALIGSATNTSRGGGFTRSLIKMGANQTYVDIQAEDTTKQAGLLFSDGSTGAFGLLQYDHATDSLSVYTNSTERLRIDSSGNVGIGTSSPGANSKLDVIGNITIDSAFSSQYGICFRRGFESNDNLRIYAGDVGFGRTGGLRIAAYDGIAFGTGSNDFLERMRIDPSGNLLVGTTDNNVCFSNNVGVVSKLGHIQASQENNGSLYLNRKGSDGLIQQFMKDGTTVGSIGTSGGDLIIGSNGTGVVFTEGINALIARSPAAPSTVQDNVHSLGWSNQRWAVLYAATGSINTSDAREKTPVEEFTADELNAAKQLSKEIGTYKFLSAIAKKGDDARKHVGMTVQRAIEIMEANNLDPFAYGFICYDAWEEKTVDHPAVEAVEGKDAWTEIVEHEAEYDEDGEVIKEAWTETIEHEAVEAVEAKDAYTEVTQEAGDRYSFRPDEMLFFIARGLEARIEQQEQRITALEG